MGMFSDLMDKIFRGGAKAERPPDAAPMGPAGVISPPPSQVQMRSGMASGSGVGTAVLDQIDVGANLDKMAAANSQKLDWRNSIVDLMKLVGMDSSLEQRRELARDLQYTGDMNDSAAMNIWLHKEVMKRLAANGGRVPAELLNR
jgi:Domain of unknown function (DUF3597)